MSFHEFDPARHPTQDVKDLLAKHLERMGDKEKVKLPDGTEVHRAGKKEFHLINRHGRKIGSYSDHQKASYHTLDMSARSHDRASLGGGTAYKSFEHFKKERK